MPDATFDPGAGPNDRIRCIRPLPEGGLLIGGDFTAFDGEPRHHIARLHEDGSLDGTFQPPLGAVGPVFALAIQSDGHAIAAGWGALGEPSIARFDHAGRTDPTFSLGNEFFGYFYALAVQPDGRILVGGSYTGIRGVRLRRIARLLPNGCLDGTFDPGAGFGHERAEREASVRAIILQPDGKILVGGDLSRFHGEHRGGVARVHPDGTLDRSFDTGRGCSGPVTSLAFRTNGSVLIGGDLRTFNGTPCSNLVQVDEYGSLDPRFDMGRHFTGGVTGLALDPSGDVLVSGVHHSAHGEAGDRILRLDLVGRADMDLHGVSSLEGHFRAMALDTRGRLLIVGDLMRADGIPCRGIARWHIGG